MIGSLPIHAVVTRQPTSTPWGTSSAAVKCMSLIAWAKPVRHRWHEENEF
jgi:hypothetical protein